MLIRQTYGYQLSVGFGKTIALKTTPFFWRWLSKKSVLPSSQPTVYSLTFRKRMILLIANACGISLLNPSRMQRMLSLVLSNCTWTSMLSWRAIAIPMPTKCLLRSVLNRGVRYLPNSLRSTLIGCMHLFSKGWSNLVEQLTMISFPFYQLICGCWCSRMILFWLLSLWVNCNSCSLMSSTFARRNA